MSSRYNISSSTLCRLIILKFKVLKNHKKSPEKSWKVLIFSSKNCAGTLSIVINKTEYFYSSKGILKCRVGHSLFGKPDYTFQAGRVFTSKHLINDWLAEARQNYFSPENYLFLTHNCNTFSDHLLFFLTGINIPDFVKNQLATVNNTPYGQIWTRIIALNSP